MYFLPRTKRYAVSMVQTEDKAAITPLDNKVFAINNVESTRYGHYRTLEAVEEEQTENKTHH